MSAWKGSGSNRSLRVEVSGSSVEEVGTADAIRVTMATRIAGEDVAADELKVAAQPTAPLVYTLAQFVGDTSIPAGGSRFSSWVNVSGYRFVTAYVKCTATVANRRIRLRVSPAEASPTGSDIQVDVSDAIVAAIGSQMVAVSNQGTPSTAALVGGIGAVARWAAIAVTDGSGGTGGTIEDAMILCYP